MTIKTSAFPEWTKELDSNPTVYINKLLLSVAFAKMSEYKRQTEVYESKYKMPFTKFKKKVESAKEENFQEWDDFMSWEILEECYKKWKKRYNEHGILCNT